MLFTVVYCGLSPRLATERLENGENRLDKIFMLACDAKFSIHDLSCCRSSVADEFFRMNMPFELGLDLGIRRCSVDLPSPKKFLIFEQNAYDTKRSLSDLAGQDVAAHRGRYEVVIQKVRDFLRVEAELDAPGPSRIKADYETCLGWITEKKIHEGHSEKEALSLPTSERLSEMKRWVQLGRPVRFETHV
ncbi:MAG TPA: hypothetical protein PK450_12990 [Paracoccaceae bacterium]|nr:hypothetical protein [Paracoccaceae bacterium]